MQNILIVHTNDVVADELSKNLKAIGCNIIDCVKTTQEALEILNKMTNIDMIMMGIDMHNNIQHIKNQSEKLPPIYIVSCNTDDLSADIEKTMGYMLQPYTLAELKQSIASNTQSQYTIQRELGDGYIYNISTAELIYNNTTIHLTKREKVLLELFVMEKNKIVSTEKILYSVWNDKVVSDKTIRTLIKQLNDKFHFNFIQNVYGQGYKTSTIV